MRILFFLIILYIILYLVLDPIKKKIFNDTLLHINKTVEFYKDYYFIKKFLVILFFVFYPFVAHIDRISLSFLINQSFILYENNEYTLDGKKYKESKIFWKLFFKKYNIPSPDIILMKENDILIDNTDKINKEDIYIYKPANGDGGNGIIIDKYKNLENMITNNDNFIIEKVIKDGFLDDNTFRKFRITTTIYGDIIKFSEGRSNEIINDSIRDVHTNIKKHCSLQVVPNLCSHLSDEENIQLNLALEKILDIHQNHITMHYSIGWDILFDGSKYSIIEANIAPLLLLDYTIDINKYKKGLYKFLTEKYLLM